MPGPYVRAVQAGDPDWDFYVFAIADVPGVVAANNYLSAFNPVGSGRIMIAVASNYASYAVGQTDVPQSMKVYRTTAASGGTLVTPQSTIPKFVTTSVDSVVQIRTGNPTVTTVGNILLGAAPVISTGAGAANTASSVPPGASFVMQPGQGLVFRSDAGDIDQRWNIQLVWAETAIGFEP